jgi:hypothetical protein
MSKNELRQLPISQVYRWVVDGFALSEEQLEDLRVMDDSDILDFALDLCD